MDAKDLRTETTIGERSNNGSSKFAQSGAAPPCTANKTYENISANPLAKLEAQTSRPCAVIGPDRIVPPSNGDAYPKKSHYEPWLHVDNPYRQPPEYPHKTPSYQSPIRNISPRQTFQENMQRIMVQPTYNSVKLNEDPNYTLDRNTTKNNKISGPHEAKYCEVPYSVNPISSDQKQNEMCVSMNSSRSYPQMWHPGSVGIRPTRPYGAPDLYQFPEYNSCAGPRPVPMPRPHRTMNEDPSHVYSETYFPEGNIRFKPYPTVKERYPQARYEYMNSYANPFHPPPPFPSHKYDLQKPLPPHVTYPQIPMKYLENRMTDTIMDGYQRPQPVNYNAQYRNQVIHPTYGPMIGNNLQNKVYQYPQDGPVKSLVSNKLPYDSKLYADYENARNKGYPMPDSVYLNEGVRPHMKNQPILPNYPTTNMQSIHAHPYYRKDSLSGKNYEYISHLRHLDPSINPNALTRLSTQFSPNSIAISPSDSNTSNETAHTHGGSLEDCGYVSQSSTTSIRSFDSSVNRLMSNDFHQRYNYPYQTMVRTSPMSSKSYGNVTANSSRDKKAIDVRQFLQMWNEGEDENGKEKELGTQSDFNSNKFANQYEAMKNHDQLYVLGLVNVPSEELGKYEHIQKISKLPENIKGYNNIELLKHFEEAIESSNINNSTHKPPTPRNYHPSMKSSLVQGPVMLPPRPISPLDVEAKISQSVIHKEVGCNFEIKPCSPEMLNAEVATTARSILGEERVIEKVSNPMIIESSTLSSTSENDKMCDVTNQKEHRIMLKEAVNKTLSCKMSNNQCSNNEGINDAKANYSLQDLESNAGVCLASLPRLDNDIELNFPEVNQQFINANKESVIIANDFTNELDAMPKNDNYKIDEHFISKSENKSVMPTLDAETEVPKLSKYRKLKRNEGEYKENQFLSRSQSLRTDSVIIKNPDNTKSLEKNTETPPLVKKTNENPVNHDLINDPTSNSIVKNQTTDNINYIDNSNEMAIDFSLSRVQNNLINKDSNNLCEIYSTSHSNSPPEKLPTDQQLAEETNITYNLPSDSTNDIKTKSSNEVNDIRIIDSKSCEIEFKKLDINNSKPNVVQCSENLSEILLDALKKETESCNIVNVSAADKMYIMDQNIPKENAEVSKKSVKSTKAVEHVDSQFLSSSIDINQQEKGNDTIFLTGSLPAVYKVTEHNDDTNSNIQNEANGHASDVFYGNFSMNKCTSLTLECKPPVVKDDCINNYKDLSNKVVTANDTIETDVSEKSRRRGGETNKDLIIGSVVRKFHINKELFSPYIQNLLLHSEGQSSLLLRNKCKNSYALTDSNGDIYTVNNLNSFKSYNNSAIQSKSTNINDYPICDSDKDVLPIDNVVSNELHSESTNVKNYPDPDLDAEVTAVDNVTNVEDCTNSVLQLESTNGCPIPDSKAEILSVYNLNNVTHSTKNESQSEFTCLKRCPVSEDSTVNNLNSVENINSKHQSEPSYVKDFPVLDSGAENFSVDNLHSYKSFTNSKLKFKSTDVKECLIPGSDVEIFGAYSLSGIKDCANDEFHSESTVVKDCPISGSGVETSAVDNLTRVNDCAKTKLQSESTYVKDCNMSDSNTDIFGVDSLSAGIDCANRECHSECTVVKECPLSGLNLEISEIDKLDNVTDCANNNKLQSESTYIKDCEISDSNVDISDADSMSTGIDCANGEIHSESTVVKDCSIFSSDIEISAVDNFYSVNECTNKKLRSESTYVKDCEISDSNVDIFCANSQSGDIRCVNGEFHSESTVVKHCPISGLDVETPEIDKLDNVTDTANNKHQSESTYVKDCEMSDSNVDIFGADSPSAGIDCANGGLHSECTVVKDCPISGLDLKMSEIDKLENVTDCANKLQSESTYVKDCEISDSNVDIFGAKSQSGDIDYTDGELHSESTVVKDCSMSGFDVETSEIGNLDSVTDCYINNVTFLSESTYVKVCEISDSNAETISVDSLSSVTDCANGQVESEYIDDKDCAISCAVVDTSAVENLTSVNLYKKFESEFTEVKECPNSASDLKRYDAADNMNSVKHCKNGEFQVSTSTNVKETVFSDLNIETADGNSVINCAKSELDSQSTDAKECPISCSDRETFTVGNLSSIEDCANSKLPSKSPNVSPEGTAIDKLNISKDCKNINFQSESTKYGKDYNICNSNNTYSITDVDILNGTIDDTKGNVKSESTDVKDCLISCSDIETSAVDNLNGVKDCANNKLQSKSTSDKVDGLNTMKDFAEELQSESTDVKAFLIPDPDLKKSFVDHYKSIKVSPNPHQLKSSNSEESISQIVESNLKTKSGNIRKIKKGIQLSNEPYLSNDLSSDKTVSQVTQYVNLNIKNTQIIDDVDNDDEVEPAAEDSGVHDIETETSISEEQVIENVLYDSNICSVETERELYEVKTIDECPEIIIPPNTKGTFIRRGLKRSLSDSALNFYNDKSENYFEEDIQLRNLLTTKKRRTNNDFLNICEPHLSTNDMLIHNNRRNSISSIYNEENMSFCIVIDNNCIITEANEEGEKLCYTEISEECLTGINTHNFNEDDTEPASEIIICPQEDGNDCNEPLVLEISDEKTLEESWVDDVACMETVVSDDIAEDIELSAPSSPTEIEHQDNDESVIFTSVSEHTEKVKYIYGDKMCYDDAELVETLYRTPQMDVNKTLTNRESHVTDDDDEFYSESPIKNVCPGSYIQKTLLQQSGVDNTSDSKCIDYNNTSNDILEPFEKPICSLGNRHEIPPSEKNKIVTDKLSSILCEVTKDNNKKMSEYSVDDAYSQNHEENSASSSVFSSPEVSSTTSEEKNTTLLLKITTYQGTRTSQLNDLVLTKTNSCKFTENINYANFISNSTEPRPLITKGAQKYIPPLKETVEDLKVKLSLPHDSLMKLKQLKMTKTLVKQNAVPKKDIPKKPKPKFEDVLKSIDEIQFKMHREKSKKPKKSVPKVVIKKTENGSHYASTPNRDCFNPDLTGRKWQPWVFIEKSSFIDKMALRRKTKAIYNHRKNTYVFADKFKKYKSMPSAKFVITQPKLDNPSVGQLKYTIRLKHSF